LVDSSDISPPPLNHAQEQKVEAILNLVSGELSGVDNEQQANVLYHVIEDLFMWRAACMAKDPRSPEEAKQDHVRFRHRLEGIVRKCEAEKAGSQAEKRGLLVKMKNEGEAQPPRRR